MPIIEIAQLRIQVRRYQYEVADIYEDANWLDVSIRYQGQNSKIWLDEPCLMTTDLLAFRDSLSLLSELRTDVASLVPFEPYVRLDIERRGALGAIDAKLELMPDPSRESHKLIMPLDLSYLPRILSQIDGVLTRFPVRQAA